MKFNDLYNETGKRTVALFYGPNCGPCSRLKPKLRAACEELGVDLVELDATVEREATTLMGIRQVPTVVLVSGMAARVVLMGDHPQDHVRMQLVAQGVPLP